MRGSERHGVVGADGDGDPVRHELEVELHGCGEFGSAFGVCQRLEFGELTMIRRFGVAGVAGLTSLAAATGFLAGHSTASPDATTTTVAAVAAATTAPAATIETATTTAPTTVTTDAPTTTVPETTTTAVSTTAAPLVSYTVNAGDSWIWIANEASVDVSVVYELNDATADTPLYPGQTVSLPAGTVVVVSTPPTSSSSTSSSSTSSNSSSSSTSSSSGSATPAKPSSSSSGSSGGS